MLEIAWVLIASCGRQDELCVEAGLSYSTLKKNLDDFCRLDTENFKGFKIIEKNPEMTDLRLQRKFCGSESHLLEAYVLPFGCHDLS